MSDQNTEKVTKVAKATKGFTNFAVTKIEAMLDKGYRIADIDREILPELKKTPLKKLVDSKEGIAILQKMKQKIRIFNPEGTERAKNSGADEHLWENEEWRTLLKSAGKVILVKPPTAKRGHFIRFETMTDEDHAWVCRNVVGKPDIQDGFFIPEIGGFDEGTGRIVTGEHPIFAVKGQLFHKWHDVTRIDKHVSGISKGFEVGIDEQINRLREAGEAARADQLQRNLDIVKNFNTQSR